MSQPAPEASAGTRLRDVPDLLKGKPAKQAIGDAPVIPIAMILLGGYLAWFGVHYWRDKTTRWPSDPLKAVLQGQGVPAADREQPVAEDIAQGAQTAAASSGAPASAGNITSVTGQQIADDALKYKGRPYKWGGATPSGWDCSGFANYVICHDLKLGIPEFKGGEFTGAQHGPTVATWLAWTGAKRVTAATPGVLVCWGPDLHMGIAISGTQLISAQDPARGTGVTDIAGMFSFPPVYLSLRETLLGTAPAAGPGGRYTHAALEGLWRLGGGSAGTANTAAAIAQAESTGNPDATSPNPDGGTNVGLWQLDTKGVGSGFSVAQLSNALVNARVAVSGSGDGSNWSDWETYANGDYRKYLT